MRSSRQLAGRTEQAIEHGADRPDVGLAGLGGQGEHPGGRRSRPRHGQGVVTENVADFAAEREVGLLFIPQKYLPAGGAQAPALAAILDRWADEHPEPYLGSDWPRT